MKTKILDCTLRDGGYYCDWDFDEELVQRYLAAISVSRMDIVEIGFRFLSPQKFLGACAYTTDDYLKSLSLPTNVEVAVMVNANELIGFQGGPAAAVEAMFDDKSQSPVDIVRIAAHSKDIESCYPIASVLKEKGYQVFLNIMQIDSLNSLEITKKALLINDWKTIDVLYFADSFGNMDPGSINETIITLRSGWDGKIGIHAHDNKGQALVNSLAALDYGSDYIDSTILGMGRGAGNTRSENLLVELTQRGHSNYFPDALFSLVLQEFKVLQEKYKWGPNIYYFLSAAHGIHPTYIQEMLSGELYDTEQVLSAIKFLKSTRSYSFENMLRAVAGIPGKEHGEWSAEGWAAARDVLIIAPGPGTRRHIGPIRQFVERKSPIVLCLNINDSVPKDIVTAYVACHETRILIEADRYMALDKPLILPLSRIPEAIKEKLNDVEILDYGMRIDSEDLRINADGCILSNSLSLMYAISVVTSAGAKRIFLSGVDGYGLEDVRHQEIVTILEQYSALDEALPIFAITPTNYPISQRSVYDPDL